ncbi:MAG: hypothetical protein K8J09_00145 [Planctomycetes bacterium]|nr:hypothetical protein [Planctomycetota bacterium]MCC7399444.1 hypothetical protein [Planctomycetota bacterium]
MNPHLCLVPFLATIVVAQSPPIPITTGVSLRHVGVATVAEGRDYRATLTAETLEFLPARGERAPASTPLLLQWLDHGCGAQRVPGAPVPVAGHGQRLVRDRRMVQEQWDLHEQGLELSVSFAARPEGDGDLIVRYQVTTTLPVARADARGVTWADEHGGVQLGAVTGIDAAGARVDGTIALEGEVLSLCLPAAFVAAARFPVLLDPLWSTATGIASGFVDTQPAGAWDATSQKYLLAWRLAYSSVQSVIRAQFLNTNGVPIGSAFTVNPAVPPSFVSSRPSVAARSGEFYVGWGGAVSSFLLPNSYAARVSAAGVVSGETLLLPQGGWIDLVGTPFSNSVSYVTSTGLGSFVNSGEAGTLLWNGSSLVRIGATAIDSLLATYARGAAPAQPFVGWFSGNYLRLATLGTLASPCYVQTTALDEIHALALAMRDDDHGVVVWSQQQIGSTRCDLWAAGFRWDAGIGQVALDVPVTLLAGDQGVDENSPTIAWLGTKYGIAWQAADANGHVDVVYREFAPGCGACGTLTPIAAANALTAQPAVIARTSTTGAPLLDGVLATVRTPGPLPVGGTLRLQPVVDAIGGPVVEAGPGCGFAGTADTIGGPCAVGNNGFAWRLTNWPAQGLTFLVLGFPGGELGCGLCTFTNPVVLEYVPPQSGTEVARMMPIPCAANLIGVTVAGQWLLLGAPTTPCPLVTNLAASRRLHATIGQ